MSDASTTVKTFNFSRNESKYPGLKRRRGVGIGPRAWNWASNHVGEVDRILQEATVAYGSIGDAANHHLKTGGKKFRPLFLLALAYAVGAPKKAAYQTAAACELLHNASLVHDDLQDHDKTRRGSPAVWDLFGPAVAINLGDHFIASTFRLLAVMEAPDRLKLKLIKLFSDTTRSVIEGQTEELRASRNPDISTFEYERFARWKSGKLLALPVASALTIADIDSAQVRHANKAMQWLGLAYQIQDDLVDLFGLKKGRPDGSDLRERRVNLPIIYYMKSLQSDPLLKSFTTFFHSANASAGEHAIWIDRIKNSDSTAQCIDHIERAVERASGYLVLLPHTLQTIIKAGEQQLLKHVDVIRQEWCTLADAPPNSCFV